MSSSRFYLMMGVLLLAAAGQVAAVPYILPVCKSIGGGSSFFDVQFCLEALGSDQRTFDADMTYRNFSVVAADLLTANATSTAAKIDALLPKGGGGATVRGLRSCQALYGGIVQRRLRCRHQGAEGRGGDIVTGEVGERCQGVRGRVPEEQCGVAGGGGER